MPLHDIYLRSILILSSNLWINPQTFLFPSGFASKMLCISLISPTHAICPPQIIFLNLMTLLIFVFTLEAGRLKLKCHYGKGNKCSCWFIIYFGRLCKQNVTIQIRCCQHVNLNNCVHLYFLFSALSLNCYFILSSPLVTSVVHVVTVVWKNDVISHVFKLCKYQKYIWWSVWKEGEYFCPFNIFANSGFPFHKCASSVAALFIIFVFDSTSSY